MITDPAMPSWLPFLSVFGAFFVVFPLFWCGVVWLISRIAGWNRLAARFAAGQRTVDGQRFDSVTGRVGVASYRNVLRLHINPEGFFMEVRPLFRCGHPRLFIPWVEITERRNVNWLFWKAEALVIGNPRVGTITLPASLLDGLPR